jgi:hypothetical protein
METTLQDDQTMPGLAGLLQRQNTDGSRAGFIGAANVVGSAGGERTLLS